jgi:hypothetical protein
MRSAIRLSRRHAAPLAAAAVFTASLAGLSTVDRDMRAVASYEGATTVRVTETEAVVVAQREDCPART